MLLLESRFARLEKMILQQQATTHPSSFRNEVYNLCMVNGRPTCIFTKNYQPPNVTAEDLKIKAAHLIPCAYSQRKSQEDAKSALLNLSAGLHSCEVPYSNSELLMLLLEWVTTCSLVGKDA